MVEQAKQIKQGSRVENLERMSARALRLLAPALFIFIIVGNSYANTSHLSIAQSEIGHGEEWGNNRGKFVRMYLNGRENLPWCAGFVSYCIKKSGAHVPYTLRAKDFLTLGKKVTTPKPGDLIIFTRKGGGHVGIVEQTTPQTITTIEGNTGDFPSKVKRITYRRSHINNFLAFVRLEERRS